MLQTIYENPWLLPATAGAVLGCLVPIVAIITDHQRKLRQAELDHELKRELLAQGRTPDEIQQILESTSEPSPWWVKHTQ
ncbi:hypothetical protein NG895_11425 [Aeoliella sp. ICT_H6.2]|uniref:Uncharacterized protein n=1 Tax=Aeoliella straminimaris TaxID=2954799 RepID=A0A9X2JG93_9BACT|nr:hypothetical protein [Aeoliella straminimaris]MCO6044516.1 hypothetical protein [Aeoliella straminimaris]